MLIYIKSMVCNRCKEAVRTTLEEVGLHPVQVELGKVELQEEKISPIKNALVKKLQQQGFDLLDDKRTQTIERVKNLITDLVHNKNNVLEMNLSDYLVNELHKDYSHLSNLFSEVEGITIEKYYILQKIERVKELLFYNELTLSEIAFQLNYSSTAHLSNQFKSVTGSTPTQFKNLRDAHRHPLDDL
ncbi:MAG: helix-turn-helix domain-containing protein [Bacteroidetes bacterium]|jgi:AraC-like DNA-binding protein|nr:helix-turn-helix domain-containing protein [Bacteroidota bacterium]